MAHYGNSNKHSHASYGAETKSNLSFTDKEMRFLKIVSKDIVSNKNIYALNHLIKEYYNLASKSNVSTAIEVMLLSNMSQIKKLLNENDMNRFVLYQIIQLLDLTKREKNILLKAFDLHDYKEIDNYFTQILQTPEFANYYNNIAKILDKEIILKKESRHFKDLMTLLLYLYITQQTHNADSSLANLSYTNNHLLKEYHRYLKHYTYLYSLLKRHNLLTSLNAERFVKFYEKHKNEFKRLNLKFERYGSYFFDKYIFMLFSYYHKKPIEEIPIPLLIIMLMFERTKILYDKKRHKYILANHFIADLIPKKPLTDSNFQKFVKSVEKNLDTAKTPLEALFTLSINEHKFLSRPLTESNKEAMNSLINSFRNVNYKEVYTAYLENEDEFNQMIDYIVLLTKASVKQLHLYNRYLSSKQGFKKQHNIEVDNPKSKYTLKYLTYNVSLMG